MKLQKDKGITLIALIVTIIILLILASVSIVMLTGENSILKQAQRAKTETENKQKEEESILSEYESKINQYKNIDWNKVLANAEKHPEQKESNVVGVGTDGNAVNMDKWEFTLLDDGTFGLNDEESLATTGTRTSGYKGKIQNGEIEGTIPKYIKISDSDEFRVVSRLDFTFDGIEELEKLPIIPDSVKSLYNTFRYCNIKTVEYLPDNVENMQGTFYGCEKLEKVKKLPNKVKNLSWTFRGCTNLNEVSYIPENTENMQATFMECSNLKISPDIPGKVTNMNSTFSMCINLTTVNRIPNSVINMINTFSGCTNLQGELIIDASVSGELIDGKKDYEGCLWQACMGEGKNLKIKGACKVLDEIIATSGSSNIQKGI